MSWSAVLLPAPLMGPKLGDHPGTSMIGRINKKLLALLVFMASI